MRWVGLSIVALSLTSGWLASRRILGSGSDVACPVPKRCQWCDRVLQVLHGSLVCPRCDLLAGVKQKGAVA